MSNENLNQNAITTNDFNNEENPLLATAVTNMDLKAFKATHNILYTILFYFFLVWATYNFAMTIYYIFTNPKLIINYLIYTIVLVLWPVYYIYVRKQQQKHFKKGTLERYEFYKNYILQRTLRNGEFIGEIKLYYQDIVRSKYVSVPQDAGYLVLYHHNRHTIIIVHLQNMPTNEIEQLQKLFGIQLLK